MSDCHPFEHRGYDFWVFHPDAESSVVFVTIPIPNKTAIYALTATPCRVSWFILSDEPAGTANRWRERRHSAGKGRWAFGIERWSLGFCRIDPARV